MKYNQKTTKTFTFDKLNTEEGECKDFRKKRLSYNFSYDKGVPGCGYGICDLKVASSINDPSSEQVVTVNGEVLRLWNFPWYNNWTNEMRYSLLYFNDQNKFINYNMFKDRVYDSVIDSTFTSVPIGISYRSEDHDYMIFSSANGNTYALGDDYQQVMQDAPKLIDFCVHDNRLYGLTATGRRTLVYSDSNNLFEWNNQTTSHLDFIDERGQMTKLVSLNDYLYIFREFGITRLSCYANGEFNISHIYKSSSYIDPNTIASNGDEIYFLTKSGFCVLSGSSVKTLSLENFDDITDVSLASAVCFENKYFLSCRINFKDDKQIGCESGDYINNAILIYDINRKRAEILRGVDVKQLVLLANPYKCKVAVCFNGGMASHIGEITHDGKVFDQPMEACYTSEFSDFGLGDVVKKVESIQISCSKNVAVTIESEKEQKNLQFEPGGNRKKVKIVGHKFAIHVSGDSDAKIDKIQISISAQ